MKNVGVVWVVLLLVVIISDNSHHGVDILTNSQHLPSFAALQEPPTEHTKNNPQNNNHNIKI